MAAEITFERWNRFRLDALTRLLVRKGHFTLPGTALGRPCSFFSFDLHTSSVVFCYVGGTLRCDQWVRACWFAKQGLVIPEAVLSLRLLATAISKEEDDNDREND